MAAQYIETTIGMTRQDIPEAVWSFYDPNGTLASSEHPEDALLSWLDSKRQKPLELPHIGAVATRQQVAMELAHVDTIPNPSLNRYDWLGIEKGALEQSFLVAGQQARETATFCLDAVARLKHDLPKLKRTPDTILAGAVLAANTHRGEQRISGLPYYEHPKAVGLLLQTAAERWLVDDPERQQLEVFDALLHDGFEHAIKKDGTSFLATPRLLISPLVISTTAMMLGFNQEQARRSAEDNLALTKPVGPDGSMAWKAYITRLDTQPSAKPKKLADLRHNRDIDPKIVPIDDPVGAQKIRSQRAGYKEAQDSIFLSYSNHPDTSFNSHMFAAALKLLTHKDLLDALGGSPWAQIAPDELVEYFEGEQQTA